MVKTLEKLQFYSTLVTGITAGLALLRTIFVVRILHPQEFGIVGLIAAVGALVGVVQHLGIDSASVREISVTKDKDEAFKVLIAALLLRFLISLPLALILFSGAKVITRFYRNPLISGGIRIVAFYLILQGFRGVLESFFRGLQKFRIVFTFQIVQSLVSLGLFVWLTYHFRVYGYFYAMLGSIAVMSLLYMVSLKKIYRGGITLPTLREIKLIFRKIFALGIVVYGIKILHTLWLRIGLLILGKYAPVEEVGYFNFVLTFGEKTTLANRAINSINLPVLTKLYNVDKFSFKEVFEKNFQKLFVIGYAILVLGIVFAPEATFILGGEKYLLAVKLFPLVLASFFIYFLFNLIGAGVLFPMKILKGILEVQFLSRLGGVFLTWLLIKGGWKMYGAALGLLIGVVPILVYYASSASSKADIKIFNWHHFVLFSSFLPAILVGVVAETFVIRMFIFLANSVVYLIIANKFEFLPFLHVVTWRSFEGRKRLEIQ